MVEAPFALFEVGKETNLAHAAQSKKTSFTLITRYAVRQSAAKRVCIVRCHPRYFLLSACAVIERSRVGVILLASTSACMPGFRSVGRARFPSMVICVSFDIL